MHALLKLINIEALPLKVDKMAAQELLNLGFAKLEEVAFFGGYHPPISPRYVLPSHAGMQ